MVIRTILFFILSLFIVMSSNAHGDLHKRILKVTQEIEAYPDSSYLYLNRGKLYFQHESFKKSIADLKISKKLGYFSNEQNLLFAKNYYRLNKYKKSLLFLNKILSKNPRDVKAIKLKAKNYYNLKKYRESALNFEKVIEYSSKTFPENYIDSSMSWQALNTNEGKKRAYEILNKGLLDLGELVSLYNRMIKILVENKEYNRAIVIQKSVINLSSRKERPYYNLSALLIQNENFEDALQYLKLSEIHFNKLPSRIQNTSFMKELKENIKTNKHKVLTKLNKS